jgi:hypothetical protein
VTGRQGDTLEEISPSLQVPQSPSFLTPAFCLRQNLSLHQIHVKSVMPFSDAIMLEQHFVTLILM